MADYPGRRVQKTYPREGHRNMADYPGIGEWKDLTREGHGNMADYPGRRVKASPKASCGSMAALPRTIQVVECHNIPEGGTQEHSRLSR